MENIDTKISLIIDYCKNIGCSKVWLFGSYAENTARLDSDIDIAISGIPTYYIFKAVAQLPLIIHHSLDIVNFDDLPENFKNNIATNGRLLYAS